MKFQRNDAWTCNDPNCNFEHIAIGEESAMALKDTLKQIGDAKAKAKAASRGRRPQSPSSTLCRLFKAGHCHYGAKCSFNHPGGGRENDGPAE